MPTWLAVLSSRIVGFLRSRRQDEMFDLEMAAHLDMMTEENVRRGLPPGEARRQAILRFGGPVQIKEEQHEKRGLPFIDTTLQDVRYALRSLRRNPAFTAVAILTLAIGVTATTSMFTVAEAVLLRPLPFAQPDRLVEISEVNPLKGWTHTVAAPANLADWRARNTVFSDIAAYIGVDDRGASERQLFLSGAGETQPLKGIGVTGNLFDVLGVRPALGRTFTYDETFEGNDQVVVLAHGTWQSIFGGDPRIVGREIVLSGRATQIIGVMPRGFFFPNGSAQLWMPLGVKPDVFTSMRRPHWMNTVARLRPGVSLAQARDQMTRIAGELERTYPDTNTKMGVRVEPLQGIMAADARPTVLVLSGAVGLLFLIVCANIASLQLGRGVGRAREFAVRRALGAARGRLVRQLLTEGLVLSTAGTSVGVALATAAPAMLLAAAPTALPLFAIPRIDGAVLLFAALLGLVAPVVFGLMPALVSSRADRLSERTESAPRHATRARELLVASEVGLAVVLLVGAVLLGRSLLQLQQVETGFKPDGVVSFKVTLPRATYRNDQEQARAFLEIERRLGEVPGILAAGGTSTLALRGTTFTSDATPEGRSPNDYERELRHQSVTAEYFRTMGVRLIAGRFLTRRDGPDDLVTLVNESLARKYFPGADAVGKRIKFGRPTDKDPWMTIVGVVANEKQDDLSHEASPEAYVALAANVQNPVTFVVRTADGVDAAVAAARRELRAVDKDLTLTDISTLSAVIEDSLGEQRFRTTLLAGFAGVALFLAALGVYGVLAYVVTQRSRELGIRLALGAKPRELFTMVVRQGMRPVFAGAGAGLVAAVAVSRLMESLLFGVHAGDPTTYAIALPALSAAALAACAIPALRATRVDPLTALRED
jgi:putative ABC transport system permease protein